jgi:glycyl-tRNA synthetase
VTVDYDSLREGSVTIRDRDTTEQVRIPAEDVTSIVISLLGGTPFSDLRR